MSSVPPTPASPGTYNPDSIGGKIAQSDIPEQVAAGVEGLTRGVLPTGYARMISKASGAGSEYDARQAKYGKTAGAAEAGGSIVRDIVSTAVAGPMALFGNAALNTAGQLADEAYEHDPRLTREHIALIAGSEALSAGTGYVGGKALEYLAPAGKVLMKGAANKLGNMLEAAPKNAQRVAKIARTSGLDELVDKAVEQGVFTRSRSAAIATADSEMKRIGTDMDVLLSQADSVAAGKPPIPGVDRATQGALKGALAQLRQTSTPAAKTVLKQGMKDLQESGFKPTEMERLIKNIKKAIPGKADGYTTGVLMQLKDHLTQVADANLQGLGINSAALRELETNYASQVALKNSVPQNTLGDLARWGAKKAGKELLIAGAEQGAEAAGVDPSVARGVGGAAGLLALGSGNSMPAGALRGAAGSALSAAYKAGRGLSNWDKNVFAKFLGKVLQSKAEEAAKAVASGVTKRAVLPTAEEALKLATQYAANPQSFHMAAYNHVDASGTLPVEHADLAANDLANLLDTVNYHLPARATQGNPIAPPQGRQLSSSQTLKLRQAVHAINNPLEALQDGNAVGVGVVRSQYPATYESFIRGLLDRVGPNAPITHPARSVIERLGLDTTRRKTAAAVQQIYKIPPPQPPGSKKPRGKENTSFQVKRVENSATHNTDVQNDSE